jgi:hypothetical protein
MAVWKVLGAIDQQPTTSEARASGFKVLGQIDQPRPGKMRAAPGPARCGAV